jgi:hypothetical protein
VIGLVGVDGSDSSNLLDTLHVEKKHVKLQI